jgi:hypothetical protein
MSILHLLQRTNSQNNNSYGIGNDESPLISTGITIGILCDTKTKEIADINDDFIL